MDEEGKQIDRWMKKVNRFIDGWRKYQIDRQMDEGKQMDR